MVQLKYIGDKKGEYFRFYSANSERVSSAVLSELLKPCSDSKVELLSHEALFKLTLLAEDQYLMQ